MHRIDTERATPEGLFQDGDPIQRVDGTIVDAAWLNSIQEGFANVVLAAGLSLEKGNHKQLYQALYPVGKIEALDDDTPPNDDWFDLTSSSGEIASTYNSANPDTTGRPDLVTYWRNKKVKEPLTVDSNGIPTGPKHFEFEVKDIRLEEISSQKHFSLQLENSGPKADMNGRVTNAIAEHHLGTGHYPQLYLSRDITIGGTTITGGEYAISRIDTTNMKFSVIFDYGSESVLSESFTSSKPTLTFYSHRIAGEAEKVWHYCRAGMAIVGAGGQHYSGGLIRRGRMQRHKHADSGHRHSITSYWQDGSSNGIKNNIHSGGRTTHSNTGYANLGNPIESDAGTVLSGPWTQSYGMGLYLYIYGGRKLTS